MDEAPSPAPVPTSPVKKTTHISDVASLFIRIRRRKADFNAQHVESSSGDIQTHPALTVSGALSSNRIPIAHTNVFVCMGGVDVPKLLRAVRASLYEKCLAVGANVLVDEQWHCAIREPKKSGDAFRVHITYSASACRCETVPDAQKPVSIERAKCVPGLMTVISRH